MLYEVITHTERLDAPLTASLKALAREQGATLNMLLQAAFQVLLHRYTGQDDFTVGVVSAGRHRAELAPRQVNVVLDWFEELERLV